MTTPPLAPPAHVPCRPTNIKQIIRVEARWAPKAFLELKASTSKMYQRLAPILSCFNTEHTWLLEWQTDQMQELVDILPAHMSKFLSIRVTGHQRKMFLL